MIRRRSSRPTTIILLILGMMAGVLAGCSSSDGTSGSDQAAGGSGTDTTADPGVDASAFPVTIDHMLGEATITEPPQRIVALGTLEQDILLALGVTPVAMVANPDDPDGVFPWAPDDLDVSEIEMLPMDTTASSIERIAALKPDLILATTASADVSLYERYKDFGVPIVAPLTGPLNDPWQDITVAVGRAIGREDAALELVAETEAAMERYVAELGGVEGLSFAVALASDATQIRVVNKSIDTSARLFVEIGMVVPAGLEALSSGTQVGAIDISHEEMGLLGEADAIFMASVGDNRDVVESNPLFASLPAVRNGAYLPYDREVAAGLRVPTPLSIPYVLEQIRPTLEKAVASQQ